MTISEDSAFPVARTDSADGHDAVAAASTELRRRGLLSLRLPGAADPHEDECSRCDVIRSALRSRTIAATSPHAITPPLVTIPLASHILRPLVPVAPLRHGRGVDDDDAASCPGRPHSGSLPSVCATFGDLHDLGGGIASSASTPTLRRPPAPFWTSPTAEDEEEDEESDESADLVPWTSRKPFVRVRLLVILLIAFTVVGFIVFSPLFHCYM